LKPHPNINQAEFTANSAIHFTKENNMKTKKHPVCVTCQGSDLAFDATAHWDHDRQEWDLNFSPLAYCDDCQDVHHVNWRES